MNWATEYIKKLKEGQTIEIHPMGNSMLPLIKSGQKCKIIPSEKIELKKNDIVLCTVKNKQYLHIIQNVKGEYFQIGNNRGGINGWITKNFIYGKYIE